MLSTIVLKSGAKPDDRTLSEGMHPCIPSNHRLSLSRSPVLATNQGVSYNGSRRPGNNCTPFPSLSKFKFQRGEHQKNHILP